MARYIGPVCKLCRREGMKLYLKGERCYSDKCAVSRRPFPPGQHGQARVKLSEYGLRLREKQKVRRIYGILERQFAKYFTTAAATKGSTGENMLSLLERRLDNVVYRMGFTSTRSEGRQIVKHNHVLVNGKRLNIPSYIVRVGDKIEIKEESRKIPAVQAAAAAADRRPIVSWVDVDRGSFSGALKSLPLREELNEPSVREQYVVEYYSRLGPPPSLPPQVRGASLRRRPAGFCFPCFPLEGRVMVTEMVRSSAGPPPGQLRSPPPQPTEDLRHDASPPQPNLARPHPAQGNLHRAGQRVARPLHL
jgi:small subunit ribosomal protein S4